MRQNEGGARYSNKRNAYFILCILLCIGSILVYWTSEFTAWSKTSLYKNNPCNALDGIYAYVASPEICFSNDNASPTLIYWANENLPPVRLPNYTRVSSVVAVKDIAAISSPGILHFYTPQGIWNVKSPKQWATNSDGTHFWILHINGSLHLFDKNGSLIFHVNSLIEDADSVESLSVSSEGEFFLIGRKNQTLEVYSVSSLEKIHTVDDVDLNKSKYALLAEKIFLNGSHFTYVDVEDHLCVVRFSDFKKYIICKLDGSVFITDQNSGNIATVDGFGTIHYYKKEDDWKSRKSIYLVSYLSVLRPSKLLANLKRGVIWVATEDGVGRLFTLDSQSILVEAGGETLGGCVSIDGTRLATMHQGGVLRLWDCRTGALIESIKSQSELDGTAHFDIDNTALLVKVQEGWVRYVKRRPEYWWGILYLPSFCFLILLILGGCICGILGVREVQKLRLDQSSR